MSGSKLVNFSPTEKLKFLALETIDLSSLLLELRDAPKLDSPSDILVEAAVLFVLFVLSLLLEA